MKTAKSLPIVLVLTSLFTLLSTVKTAAAVEAVQIRLHAGSGGTLYVVPAGKVLIVEHVMFSDYWTSHDENKRLIIRHGGGGTTGTIWNTTQNYFSGWNQISRPLRLPAGKALAAPYLNDGAFQIFIYGRLVDESDLYASVSSEINDVQVEFDGAETVLHGTVDLASPRPAQVRIEKSGDLKTWETDTEATITSVAPDAKTFDVKADTETGKLFVRAAVQPLPDEED